ncbi:MAG: hypothetical protein ABI364_04745 [Caldimonas sp.]
MTEERIIAVSFEGGERLEHITYVWTIGGVLATQRAVDDLWARRCRYYVVMPSGRLDVDAVPARVPNPVAALFGKRFRGHLESPRGNALIDGLLTLPRLPSPARPRRSQAQANVTL